MRCSKYEQSAPLDVTLTRNLKSLISPIVNRKSKMTTLDPEKQKQAKEYARIRRRLWLVDNIFSAVYALAWLFFGWAISLRDWLTDIHKQ